VRAIVLTQQRLDAAEDVVDVRVGEAEAEEEKRFLEQIALVRI